MEQGSIGHTFLHLHRGRVGLVISVAAIGLLTLFHLFAAPSTQVIVAQLEPGGDELMLEFGSSKEDYHRIEMLQGGTNDWQVIDLCLGINGMQHFQTALQDIDTPRGFFRVENISTNAPLDLDEDGMHDVHELLTPHLDAMDETDAAIDTDGDALSNLEEFNLNLDSGNADSDGDGFDDGEEVKIVGTDPNAPDSVNVKDQLFGSDFTASKGQWAIDGTTARNTSLSGELYFDISIPTNGMFFVDVSLSSQTVDDQPKTYHLACYLGEEYVGRKAVNIDSGASKTTRFRLPYLPAGPQVINLFHLGSDCSKQLIIEHLNLLELPGADTNNNGIADWSDAVLQETTSFEFPPAAYSHARTVTIEGHGAFISMMSSPDVNIKKGAGERWYAQVSFGSSDTSKNISISFQNGAITRSHTINRIPHDVSTGNALNISFSNDRFLVTPATIDAHPGTVHDLAEYKIREQKGLWTRFRRWYGRGHLLGHPTIRNHHGDQQYHRCRNRMRNPLPQPEFDQHAGQNDSGKSGS